MDVGSRPGPARAFARRIWNALGAVAWPRASPSISRDAVVWGYRFLLDREPESAAVVEEKLARGPSLDDLRRELVGSEEFRRNALPGFLLPTLTGREPALPVETAGELEPLFAHIQRAWERMGETEPHWSVLTEDAYRAGSIAESRERFYDTGRASLERFTRTLERNGVDRTRLASCLEFGCGVGRVTPWLSKAFATVVGCDISRSHLKLAREELDRRGAHNVTLLHLDHPRAVAELPRVDAVYTVIVLQHNPPPIIAFTVRQLIRALNPGGIAYFQVPTYRTGYRFSLAEYLRKESGKAEMEMHVLPQPAVFDILEEEGARPLEVLEDDWAGLRAGDRSNTFLVRKGS